MAKITVTPLHPSIFNFQSCILSESFVKELEQLNKNNNSFFDTFVRINFGDFSVLNRWCKSTISDGVGLIQCDIRVEQLFFSFSTPSNQQDEDVCCEKELELSLGRHLLRRKKAKEKKKMTMNKESTFGFDVDEEDEEEMESSMRFNDALYCTSKDIEILKSGTIKKMRLTVICDAVLSDFLYETNHKMTRESLSFSKTTKKSPSSFHQQEKTTAKEENTEDGTRNSSWKLLREKIHQIFTSYDIHVRKNVLLDLRNCPLSTKTGWPGCPSFAFIFVEECVFRSGGGDDDKAEAESDVVGKVVSKTEILINHVHHISHFKLRSNNKLNNNSTQSSNDDADEKVFGVENAGKVLSSLIEMQQQELGKCLPSLMDNFYSHGLLIAGPSGCGKGLVVRETVKKLRGNLLVYNKLVGKSSDVGGVGDSWTQIFNDALLSSMVYPTVLLIPKVEECLLILQGKEQNSSNKNSANKLLNHVCNLFDAIPPNAMLTVVATTDQPYLIPAKLRRTGRLEREVYIGAPTEEERLNILKSLSKKVPSLSKLDLDSVAQRTPGYVGQDLIRVAHLAILKSYEENCSTVTEAHIKYALSRILPSVLQGTLGVVGIHRNTSLDHIAGLSTVKHDLIKAIVWPLKFPHAFRTMGITPPKGILLHSPPGCAKTTLVRAVAASHQTNFLSVSAAELFSSGVGDSEKIVADLFHRARMASPCILFIDELEAIVGSRQMSQKKTTNESILSMLLTEMDGIGTLSSCVTDRTSEKMDSKSFGPLVLVVAATNRIDMIDSALIRPGRFDKLIYVPPLDKEGRLELFSICAKTTPFSPEVNFEEIAKNTEHYSGADIVNLCKEAALLALCKDMNSSCVSSENLLDAMSTLSPSLSSS